MQTKLISEKSERENRLGSLCINIVERIYKCSDSDQDNLCRAFSHQERYNPNDQECRDVHDLILGLVRQKYVRVVYRVRGQEFILDSASLRLTRKGITLLRTKMPDEYSPKEHVIPLTETPRKRMADYSEFRAAGLTNRAALAEIQKNQVRA